MASLEDFRLKQIRHNSGSEICSAHESCCDTGRFRSSGKLEMSSEMALVVMFWKPPLRFRFSVNALSPSGRDCRLKSNAAILILALIISS